jgi:hypothetical protein
MGMFDTFIAEPPLRCRSCGSDVSEFQGKDGPCALFVWKQGVADPVRQAVDDEWAIPDAERAKFRLPDEFELHTDCPRCHVWIVGTGYCSDNVWTSSTYGVHIAESPIAANDVGASYRQCSGCADAWQESTSLELSECPGCRRLTRLQSAAVSNREDPLQVSGHIVNTRPTEK